ncbi:Tyrocidine synthase 3 [Kordia antarctica]|uniref:Tyrocidine synthase 3 n=2 Tax=Kordia antarctica TaxID=1218801 RepID=A0A7L4ZFG1_9FLAO|nr:Tyrocidine synthase 3 [Kordia antarctica]
MYEQKDHVDLVAHASYSIAIGKDEIPYFSKLTNEKEIVEFTVLLTIFGILLKRHFDECHLVFSKLQQEQNSEVLFVLDTIQKESFKSYLNSIKKEVQETYKHALYNKKHVETLLRVEKIEDYSSFGFMYSHQNQPKKYQLPFQFSICKKENSYQLTLAYNEDFIEQHVAENFVNIFKLWLVNLEDHISQNIAEIPILTAGVKDKLLFEFNDVNENHGGSPTIIDLFEKQVAKTPKAIALTYQDKEFSYEDIEKHANQFARYLIEVKGIKSNDFVGVKLERTEHLVIAILSVLKAGATYVPIDVNYPEERITYIENDSNCVFVIDAEKLLEFSEIKNNYLNTKVAINTIANDLAYIIYTSGTTGNPKGVMITHSNAVQMIFWAQNEFDLAIFDVVFAATSHCFDLSVFEMFYTLSVGKKIRVLKDALAIAEYLPKEEKILLNTVPSAMRTIIDGGSDLNNVVVINLAGEPFPLDIASKLTKTNIIVKNLYGPSEDTTYSTAYTLQNKPYKTIPIGKPITNTQAYILDENLKLLPIGVIGKLYLAGAGITKGYLNRPELTDEKYIQNPFATETRMYDTGDLARWCPDGNIEFFGRKDHQVKLRGYRIELGEIENDILQFSEEMLGAVAAVKTVKNVQVLVGYYASLINIDKSKLRDYLAEKLPAYMIPTYFMRLKEIPLTPNGKVNRKALPDVSLTGIIKKEFVAPRNTVEEELVTIWQEVIGVSQIGIKDNFFELGGHSLMIAQIINRISKEMCMNVRYKTFHTHPTIEGISNALEEEQYTAIETFNLEKYPVTASQHRLWMLSQLEGGIDAYNITGALRLKGTLHIENFEKAFNLVIDRHEILRTYFDTDSEGTLRQYSIPTEDFNFKISFKDVSNSENALQKANQYIDHQITQGFSLSKAPLISASLVKIENNDVIFFIAMHHIISDGWSLEIFTSEVLQNYEKLQANTDIITEKLRIQFKDYAVWLDKNDTSEAFKNAKTYWMKQFEGELPILQLPSYTKRPTTKTYAGNYIEESFSENTLVQLKNFSQKHQVTLFMTLMAAVKTLLSRYSNQQDIIVGTPIAGRAHPDLENQLGLYLNTLAIRTSFEEDSTFSDLLNKEKQLLLDAYNYQNYPFDQLIEQLQLKRDTSRSPLFDVMVVLQNQQQSGLNTINDIENLSVATHEITRNTAQFDIAFTFSENDRLQLGIQYNTDIYDENFIKHIFIHLENIFNQITATPEITLSSIDLTSDAEKEVLLHVFNATDNIILDEVTVLDLFKEQVLKSPNALAIQCEGRKITYAELDAKSNELANYILQKINIAPKTFVAIQLERTEKLIIAELAILKTGAAYVPIDMEYPQNRVDYILKDSNAKLNVNNQFLIDFEKTKKDANPIQNSIFNEQLAYLIYTSGSTGKPKGVMISHKSLLNLCFWHQRTHNVTSKSNATLFAGIGFDASVLEIYPYLISGATLFPIQKDEIRFDISKLAAFFKENTITHAYVPTRVCQDLIEQEIEELHTNIFTGGEALSYSKPTSLRVFNYYGPTESTVVATYYNCQEKEVENIPIGKPVDNTKIYILTKENSLQPLGIIGELCISGEGLAQGYLNSPELTAEKFVPHPIEKGKRLYKTGDLARWLPNGNIEFAGRKDTQIKIRGFRIELGEIEQSIRNYAKTISQVLVIAKDIQGEKRLIAYYISSQAIESENLIKYLKEEIPSYMIPQYFKQLESIPLTANGKVAVKKLPEISSEDGILKAYVAPTNDIEKSIAAIWEKLLGQEKIGVDNDFFELGGHSLLLTKLLNAYHKTFNVALQLKDVYVHTKLKQHATLISGFEKTQYQEIPKLATQELYELSPTQMRYWMIHKIRGKSREFNIFTTFNLPENFDITLFNEAFNEVLKRHEILRTVYVESIGKASQKIISHQLEKIPTYATSNIAKEQVFHHEFDLESYPLFKTGIVTENGASQLFFNIHHSICDGWSMNIIVNDVMEIYHAKKSNTKPNISELSIQYKDYAAWQNSTMLSTQFEQQANYWKTKLNGDLPYLQLPYDFNTKVKTANTKAAYHTIAIDEKLKQKIEKLATKHNTSVFTIFVATLKIVLNRLTSENDIIIGIPAANRTHEQLKDVVGCFLNTLMLRDTIDKTGTFSSFLQNVNTTVIDALGNQNYSFEQLLEELHIPKDYSRFPISSVFLNMLDFEAKTLDTITNFESEQGEIEASPKFDFECYIKTFQNGFTIRSVYNSEYFKKETIVYWMNELVTTLTQVVENPATIINAIDIFNTPILSEPTVRPTNNFTFFEATEVTQNIAARFENQVEKYPNNIAVHCKDKNISYRSLNNYANQLAQHILTNVTNKTKRIALLLGHDERCVIGMLGVLKSGYGYVPIDINNPTNRIEYILQDSDCNVIICSDDTQEKALQLQAIQPELRILTLSKNQEEVATANLNKSIAPQTEAYVLYTSGSTGMPKGVLQIQKNVLHYIRVYTNEVHISENDKLSVFSTYTFDASVKDIYGAILNGATVCIYDIIENGLQQLPTWLALQKVTIIHMVPTLYRHFIKSLPKEEKIHTVRLLDLGGEACYKSDVELFKEYFPKDAFLINDYGPTEATIVSQKFVTNNTEITRNNLSLGKPVTETEVFIWDEANHELGIYQEGEIVFKSEYLSLGYLNKEEQTKKVFLASADGKSRIYKSGDIGRKLPNGEIEFLNRRDSQVKLNGQRIELSEIEYQLEQLENIKQVVVLVNTINETEYLTAYVQTVQTITITAEDIKRLLNEQLPNYMIPSIFMFMDEFPLTRTGKISRKELPLPELSNLKTKEYIAPENETEQTIVNIIAEALSIPSKEIGIHDSFFELGATSIKILELTNLVNQKLETKLRPIDFFQSPSVHAITNKIIHNDSNIVDKVEEDLSEKVDELLDLI